MNVPPKIDSFIAKRFPKTSATGEYMTVTATRAFWRIIAGGLAVFTSVIGLRRPGRPGTTNGPGPRQRTRGCARLAPGLPLTARYGKVQRTV